MPKSSEQQQTNAKRSEQSSAGSNSAAVAAPPDYGMAFLDAAPEVSGAATATPEELAKGLKYVTGQNIEVDIHYNSVVPGLIGAYACVKGREVYVAPGGEKYLDHEFGHIAANAKGPEIKATARINGFPVCIDDRLEKQADAYGKQIVQMGKQSKPNIPKQFSGGTVRNKQSSLVFQAQFKGPNFKSKTTTTMKYRGHKFTMPGGKRLHTECGINNVITTAGEELNNAVSKPGTPKKMNTYRGGFSRAGGLVRDKNLKQASTRLHLINQRLENSGNTQNNPTNIFLGTQKANNPTHLHQVENIVINALDHSSLENNAYENAMMNATVLMDNFGEEVLYWENGNLPDASAVKHKDLTDVYANAATKMVDVNPFPVAGAAHQAQKQKLNHDGKALGYGTGFANYIPTQDFRHLWLKYSVTANYAKVPAHIMPGVNSNVGIETAYANLQKPKKKNNLLNKIKSFKTDFSPNAFPRNFTNVVHYYYASYDPADIYKVETETHIINADL